jgi:hypothetical protein
MQEIPLSKGMTAVVDEEDFERVNQFKWTLQEGRTTFYAARNDKSTGKRVYVYLHRFIMGVEDSSIMVDHINGNGLDNRRENLRVCDNTKNQQNRGKKRSSGYKYKGIRKRYKNSSRVSARIRHKGREIYLGTYPTEEEAARAYDRAALDLFGDFAQLNFDRGEYSDHPNN